MSCTIPLSILTVWLMMSFRLQCVDDDREYDEQAAHQHDRQQPRPRAMPSTQVSAMAKNVVAIPSRTIRMKTPNNELKKEDRLSIRLRRKLSTRREAYSFKSCAVCPILPR